MTFKEKFMQDYPGKDFKFIMNNNCPSHYGYEKENSSCEKLYCSECWDREILEQKKLTIQEAIDGLKNLFSEHELDLPCTDSLEMLNMAITVLEKQIPKEPIIKPWDSARCPTCGCGLSEHRGDGYYKHYTHLRRCLNEDCAQKLEWS